MSFDNFGDFGLGHDHAEAARGFRHFIQPDGRRHAAAAKLLKTGAGMARARVGKAGLEFLLEDLVCARLGPRGRGRERYRKEEKNEDDFFHKSSLVSG